MKRASLFLLGMTFILSTSTTMFAQSNYDLAPPLQADINSQQVQMSPDPSALPTFKFAMAKLNDDGEVEVATTSATQKLIAAIGGTKPDLSKGIPYTENVTQTYTVSVPYTEVVDGVSVTRTRAETRTRQVLVTRYRKRNAEEQAEYDKKVKKEKAADKVKPKIDYAKNEKVRSTYSINVPYTEMVDGKAVTRMRVETRARTMQVLRGTTETMAKTEKKSYKMANVKCFSVDGTELDPAAAKKRLSENSPVILINGPKAIAPYFEAILKPNALFMVCEDK